MDMIRVRCTSCAALLKVRADKAGRKGRCNHCGAVVLFPARPSNKSESKDRPAVADGAADADQPQEAADNTYGVVTPHEPISARRRRPPRPTSRNLSATLRRAPGWRKVRIGLILIGLSLCAGFLFSLFAPLLLGGVGLLLQSVPITGYLLCAFVPLKGAARNLALANLGVIAVGLTLTLVAWRMTQRETDRSEQLLKLLAGDKKAQQEEQDLRKKLAELRKKGAAAEARELETKLAQMREKRVAEIQEASKAVLADLEVDPSRSRSGRKGVWGWIHASMQWFFLQWCIQIILLSYFIQAVARALSKTESASAGSSARMPDFLEWMAFGRGTWLLQLIARALGEKDLAGACPRVALAALVTVSFVLITQLVSPTVWLAKAPGPWVAVIWITNALGLVTFVWQELVLIEACMVIGKHVNPDRPEPSAEVC